MYFINNNYFQILQCTSGLNNKDDANNNANSAGASGASQENPKLQDFIQHLKNNNNVIYSKDIDFNNIQQPEQKFDVYRMYNNINKYFPQDKLPLALEGLSKKLNQLFTNVNLSSDLAPSLGALSGIWTFSPMSSDNIYHAITQSNNYHKYKNNISQLISKLPDASYNSLHLNYLKDDEGRWANTNFNNINAEKYWKDMAKESPILIDILICQFDQHFINSLNDIINQIVNEGLKNNNIITNNNKREEYISKSMIETITNMHLFQFLNSAPDQYGVLHQLFHQNIQPILILAINIDTALSIIKKQNQITNFQTDTHPDIIKKLIVTCITVLKHTLEPKQLQYLINEFALVNTDEDKTQLVKELTRILIVQILNKFIISRQINN